MNYTSKVCAKQKDEYRRLVQSYIERLPNNITNEFTSIIKDLEDCRFLVGVSLDIGRKVQVLFQNGYLELAHKSTQEDIDCVIQDLEFDSSNTCLVNDTLHRVSAMLNKNGTIVGITYLIGYVPRFADTAGCGCSFAGDQVYQFGRMPGVYCLKNTESGKKYIGSSTDVRKRLLEHRSRLQKGKHENRHLQAAYNKFGENSFICSVYKYIPRDKLARLETYYIQRLYNKGVLYNQAPIAYGAYSTGRGSYVPTEEHRRKISEAKKGWVPSEITRARNGATKLGKKWTEERKKNHPKSWLGKNHTDVSKNKMSEYAKSRKEHTNLIPTWESHAREYPAMKGPDGTIYPSGKNVTKFCKDHGLNQSCISKLVRGLQSSHKGFTLVGGPNE